MSRRGGHPGRSHPLAAARRWCVRAAVLGIVCLGPSLALAQTSPTPLLDQLSQETQQVHRRVTMSLVSLHLPRPASPAAQVEELFRKWDKQLDPAVKQKLQQELQPEPSPGDAEDGDVFSMLRDGELGSSAVLIRPFGAGELADQPLRLLMTPQRLTPRTVGVILDERGHVLVPAFVDRDLVGQRTLKVLLDGGTQADATFVGSDRQTNVTLLRLTKPSGTPADMADRRPADGSLVLVFSPHSNSIYLSVWTGGLNDNGIVVTTNGRIAGFAHGGQFLSSPAVAPIVQQLVEFGEVKRAVLGVRVTEVRPNDPIRQQLPALGRQPAMRVERVYEQSAADKSGLRPGDLILSVAGESVGDLPTFAAAIAARQGPTEMRVLRDGQIITVRVELARQ